MREKRSVSTRGIILRIRNFGEQDRFITFYTPDYGKITCLAKGVRKISSRRAGHIELMNRVKIELWKSRHQWYLTQCSSEENFKEIKRKMPSIASGIFILEAIDRLTMEEHPLPELFDILNKSLQLMEFYSEDHAWIREIILIKLLKILGYINSFKHCGTCREKLPEQHAYWEETFNVLCESCLQKKPPMQARLERLDFSVLKLMNFILEHPLENTLMINKRLQHKENIEQWGRRFLYKNLSHQLKSEEALRLY